MKEERPGRAACMLQGFISKYKNTNVAVRASLWFAVSSVVQRGISVLTMPIFTRLMDTEQYGQYQVFLTWYNILVILITLNVHTDIFNKGLIEHADEKDMFTASQAGLLIALTAVWSAIYLPFRAFFNRLLGLSTVLMLFMILEILGSSLISLWMARRRFEFDYRRIVRLTLSMSVLNPVGGAIFVILSEHKAEARIISNAVIPIIVAIFVLWQFSRRGKLFGNCKWWKPALLAALPLIPHYLSLVLLNQSDKLMINYYKGSSDAAIYSVAHSAGLLTTIVSTSINSSFVPWSYDQMKNHGGEGIRSVSRLLLLLVLLCNVGIIWVAPEAVRLLAAPQYSEAAWCMVPIAMSVFFFFTYTLFVDVEIYYGANRFIAIASVCAAVLNIVLNYLFVPRFGYIAAGYTTLFSYAATMLLHLLFLNKVLTKLGKRMDLFDCGTLAAFTVLLIALSALGANLYKYPWIRFAVVAVSLAAAIHQRKRIKNLLQQMTVR